MFLVVLSLLLADGPATAPAAVDAPAVDAAAVAAAAVADADADADAGADAGADTQPETSAARDAALARAAGQLDEPPALWMFLVVPAGLSLTTSLVLAVPELLLLAFATTTTLVVVLAGAPLVAGFGIDRLDHRRSLLPIVGSVVGDVAGVVAGVFVGGFAWLRFGGETAASDDRIGPVSVSQASLVASAVAGAWLFRAVGSGVGSVAGRVVALSLDPETVSP